MTNVVASRGHENFIWDVKWSPMGVYFATASRDRRGFGRRKGHLFLGCMLASERRRCGLV